MKIQCPCGAKYSIDVTPGMQPVQFICPNCGQDYSAFVNDLIRRELGESAIPVATPAPRPVPVATAPQPAAPPPSSGLKISKSRPAETPPEETAVAEVCSRHHEPATEHCTICKKPICPKCMETFGYFCSPFCKAKAEAQSIRTPVYAGQKFEAEARFWRKAGSIFAVVAVLAVLGIGVWFWYAWFGSVPHTYFSVHFDNMSYSGGSYVTNGQIVFLHGGTLARYDMKTKKPVWSLNLVTTQQIADEMKREDAAQAEAESQAGHLDYHFAVLPYQRQRRVRMALESELSLHVCESNIWVAGPDKLTRYDWNTGKVLRQIPLANGFGEFAERGDEFVKLERTASGGELVTRISMATGDSTTQEFPGWSGGKLVAPTGGSATALASNGRQAAGPGGGAGLPLSPNGDQRPLNPGTVAAQAQNLSPAGRIALPAVLGNSAYEQKIVNALNDNNSPRPRRTPANGPQPNAVEDFTLVPDGNNYLEFGERMTERHIVEREAMKAPPKKSALDSGTLGIANETAAINQQLNEMQRNRGADKVTVNLSRYQVTLRRPGSPGDTWTGDVIGPPQLLPLKTVNVLTAGTNVIVFDKSNKKLWQANLTYPVPRSHSGFFGEPSPYGKGPCAENGGTLYVFDQAVLTAFDVANGNVRWRLPSVGIVGLFFDDQGMVYVNTTTASPEDLKYARQIDVTKKIESVLLKIDAKTGRTLWSIDPHGLVCYVSGQYIYAVYSFDPGDEEDQGGGSLTGMLNPPFLRIRRINPEDGRMMWEYTQGRAPVSVQFDRNSIQLVYKKEVQVLRYYTF